MKVIQKQRNSKMCIMCGLDNEYGVRAPFYTMEDDSVMTVFSYREQHQSYPGRVHGGLVTCMLDEMGLRALWAKERSEKTFGVTTSLETKYRKPVPYNETIIGKGTVIKDTPLFCVAEVALYDRYGTLLANGKINYVKLDVNKISADVVPHEEMCYLVEDGVTEINFDKQ
ncbi:MAG: PaaI family thioesterase [Firmicutes bacterium]|nr:PaaI family thioesterase [Bacillota bacterium]